MQILPVLDLMNGVVVRGVAGRRCQYRPIVSRLTSAVQPLDVAQAFHDHFGLDQFYLADLDALAGKPPALHLIAQLLDRGFRLWVDAGIGENLSQVRALAGAGVQHIIAGLESLAGPEQLRELLDSHGPHLIFSLDMHHGQPLAKGAWPADPWHVAVQAVGFGVQRILVLDLAAVGSNQGTPVAGLCARCRSAFPTLEITTGGGVRDVADLRILQQLGVDYVLIASALHDGRLTAEEVRSWKSVL